MDYQSSSEEEKERERESGLVKANFLTNPLAHVLDKVLLSRPKSKLYLLEEWVNRIRAKTINSLGAELRFGVESDTSFYS